MDYSSKENYELSLAEQIEHLVPAYHDEAMWQYIKDYGTCTCMYQYECYEWYEQSAHVCISMSVMSGMSSQHMYVSV